MNNPLKKEIILHIFKTFGIFSTIGMQKGFIEPITNDKFLIDKKIVFETEDKKKHNQNIWAYSTKIETSVIKIMVIDITDDVAEFILTYQMDNFPPCALRLSADKDDFGSFNFLVEDKWIIANSLMQGKIFVGFESLSEIFAEWNKLSDYAELYKLTLGFLNYYEQA